MLSICLVLTEAVDQELKQITKNGSIKVGFRIIEIMICWRTTINSLGQKSNVGTDQI